MPGKKLTIGFVRKQFEKENYTLLSEKYTNSSTKLKFRCPNNHEHSICWDKWRDGRRCRKCAYENKKGSGHLNWKGGPKKSYCIDCEKKITYGALRCRKCQDKYRTGNKHSGWKGGKPKCVDCGKQLTNYNNLKCSECYHKYAVGENNPSWAGGLPKCIGCGKQISRGMLRCKKCWYKHYSGENHYNWQGGISCEPYCQVWRNKEFKQHIRDRDNNTAWDIGYWWKGSLSIHHIDYDKGNCNPNNLITISIGMNSAANTDREFHTEWFQILMEKRYEHRSHSI